MVIENKILVSVIIPCYNEKDNINKCIQSLICQNFEYGEYEIIVVDGMSEDGTKEILQNYLNNCNCFKIVENRKRFTPYALNLGIENSKGRFISILGAHSVYHNNYLSNSYKLFLDHPEVDCTGGPIISDGKTSFGKAAALAMSHPIGVGNAKHRFPNYKGYAEGACFPMFRREVFDKIGLYDEKLIRNQDDELNFRLTKQGGKVYISPEASSVYFVRDNPASLFEQYYQYGFWRVAVMRKHKQPIALRQIVPVVFIIILMLSLMYFIFMPSKNNLLGLAVPVIYFGTLIAIGVRFALIRDLKVSALFPLATMILHISYGIGFIAGSFSEKTKF